MTDEQEKPRFCALPLERRVSRELTNQQLRAANVALVQALDRVHDVLSGDEYVENADIGIHEIINEAIRLHNLTANVELRGCALLRSPASA